MKFSLPTRIARTIPMITASLKWMPTNRKLICHPTQITSCPKKGFERGAQIMKANTYSKEIVNVQSPLPPLIPIKFSGQHSSLKIEKLRQNTFIHRNIKWEILNFLNCALILHNTSISRKHKIRWPQMSAETS